MRRRVLLVLALTALLVASAFASGSAWALSGDACEGLATAVDAQTTQTLPPQGVGPAPPPEGAAPFPGQGGDNSALDPGVVQTHHCEIPGP